jgi:EAL domain-containing protein (putative c-di-GMP-specific phosphodiesterase class I)
LNTSCVVEGVEEAGELQTLIGMGADLLQGYLFARPSTVFVRLTAAEIRRAAA